MDVKECSALGRSGYLGAFYDAREDKFRHGSLFNTFNLPDSCVNRVDVNFSNIEYTCDDSYSKRFEKLDVSAELRVSLFAGLLDLKGSGKYLKDHKTTSRSVKGTVLYNIRTKEEKININDEQLKTYISLDGLELAAQTATHFVGGIVWGANTFASIEYSESRDNDLTRISGHLEAQLKWLKASVNGSGDVTCEGSNEKSSSHFRIKVYGDVIPGQEELPETKEEALALIRQTPTYVAQCNDGKGKPITFTLYPVIDVVKMMKLQLVTNAVVNAIDTSSVLEIEQTFNDFLLTTQSLNDFYEDLTSPSAPHFSSSVVQEVCTFKNNVEIAESQLKNNIREALALARTDPNHSSALRSVIREFLQSEFCPVKIRQFIEKWNFGGVLEKVQFIKDIHAKGAIYLASKNFGVDFVRATEKNFFALVFHDEDHLYTSELWKKNYDLFFRLLNEKDDETLNFCFYVLEMIDQSPTDNVKAVTIYHCVENVIETEDLYQRLTDKYVVPLAKSCDFEFCAYRPNKSSLIKTRCPGSIYSKCGLDLVKWKCEKDRCRANLYYGYDGFLYCNCGKAKVSSFSYKCTDKNHGTKWIRFESEDDIVRMMEELIPPEEINILVLGETGVGKSTFINAFANYLTYSDLEEAEANELIALIPTSFTVTDEDYTEKLIKFGEDPNESGKRGGSQTQACRSYTFPSGDRLVRLMDTPGIGDTAGIDRDVKNFENILNYITNYPVLNGILILLKPNNSRISVMFRFCIQELLCHIHRNASENIVFVFTNSRGTFYRPGDTLPSLRGLLQENESRTPHVQIALNKSTIYCLDNESFRFLVAIKSGVTFPEDERLNFKGSWDRSVNECARLLEHVCKIKPHAVRDTLSLNEARKLIILLSKPLCDISQNIQTNIMNIEDQETKIQEAGEDINKLKKELYVPGTDLVQVTFDQPRTVCTAEECREVRTNSDGTLVVHYKTVCHNPCKLQNVTANIINNSDLLNCAAIDGRHCIYCKCPYEKHMHIYYENKEVAVQVINVSVQKDIRNKEDLKKEKMKILIECQERRAKLEREQDIITQASAKFAHFLKVNAITPYNDALKDYLEHLIVVERQKSASDPERQRVVEELSKMLGAYKSQVAILERNFTAAGNVPCQVTPDMINDLVKDLYGLEINGNFIRSAVEAQQLARTNQVSMFSEKMFVPRTSTHARHGRYPKQQGHRGNEKKPGFVQRMKNKLHDFFFYDDVEPEEADEFI